MTRTFSTTYEQRTNLSLSSVRVPFQFRTHISSISMRAPSPLRLSKTVDMRVYARARIFNFNQ